jgi:hypothetical protein
MVLGCFMEKENARSRSRQYLTKKLRAASALPAVELSLTRFKSFWRN